MPALSPHSPIGRLLAGPLRPGRLEWIGLRPARRAPILDPAAAKLIAGHGLEGDHYDTQRNGPRQVTLIAAEDLAAMASFLGLSEISPALLRRNLVIRGINLLALKDRRFRVGAALLEGSGECAPCSLMEEAFGPGGYNAVRGHGGITARVIESGVIAIGDAIERVDNPQGALPAEYAALFRPLCDTMSTPEPNCADEAMPDRIWPRFRPDWIPTLWRVGFRLGLGRELGMQHVVHRQ